MPIKADFNERFVFLDPSLTLNDLINYINANHNNWFELGLVVDQNEALIGVINNLDIIKAISKAKEEDVLIKDVMNPSPIKIDHRLLPKEIIREVKEKVTLRTHGLKELTRFIPLVNEKQKVVEVADVYQLISKESLKNENVEIYGLGFVGITLAASLASVGHNVTGIDVNENLINKLKKGEIHVHEPGLSDLNNAMRKINKLNFCTEPPNYHNKFYIVCVGTPIGEDGTANLKDLATVLGIISNRLKIGDNVMLRSTIPVGTTRNFAKSILESNNNLQAGKDFHLCFTPERTVEGNAIEELKTLPQIVGGLTPKCKNIALEFWQTLVNVVIPTDCLESAELVKLINNSFRDLTFAFSNALTLLADQYNIDSNELIYLANEGYPRNRIAKPSPGVGGYCLTKDPLLYASTNSDSPHAKLSKLGREINEEISEYPLKVFNKFIDSQGLSSLKLKILIIGIAFKGWPETNDLRGSVSLKIAENLKNNCSKLDLYDAVLSKDDFKNLNFNFCDIYQEKVIDYDAIFILNNHPKNIRKNFLKSLPNKKIFIFDGWNLLEKRTVLGYENLHFYNLGFNSPK